MKAKVYNVGAIREIIKESASEFKPKLGDGVVKNNLKNNEKSYKDSETRAKKFDGGLSNKKPKRNFDRSADSNGTLLDFNPKQEPSKEYKERVKAQMKGYTSTLEEKNGIEKQDEYDDDSKMYNALKDNSLKRNKEKEDLSSSGLVGRVLPKVKKNSMYENTTPKPKRLVFKRAKFVNEAQMLNYIPEDYKVDGQKIFMRDCQNNEYIVECKKIPSNGRIETIVKGYQNEEKAAKQLERIHELFGYETSREFGPLPNKTRVEESKNFADMLKLAHELNKPEETDDED